MCNSNNADMLHAMLTSWLQQVFTIRHVHCAFAITNLDAAEVRCQAHLHGSPLRVPAKLGTRPEPMRRCRTGLQATLSPCAEQPAQSPSKLAGLAGAIMQVNAGPPWGTMRVRCPSAITHVAPGHARCTLNAYTATPSLPHDCATGGAAMCHTCTGSAVNMAEGWVPKQGAECRACYGPQLVTTWWLRHPARCLATWHTSIFHCWAWQDRRAQLQNGRHGTAGKPLC